MFRKCASVDFELRQPFSEPGRQHYILVVLACVFGAIIKRCFFSVPLSHSWHLTAQLGMIKHRFVHRFSGKMRVHSAFSVSPRTHTEKRTNQHVVSFLIENVTSAGQQHIEFLPNSCVDLGDLGRFAKLKTTTTAQPSFLHDDVETAPSMGLTFLRNTLPPLLRKLQGSTFSHMLITVKLPTYVIWLQQVSCL